MGCVHDLVRIPCAYTKIMCSVCVLYHGLFTNHYTMNCDAGTCVWLTCTHAYK